ncbi:MAG: hypothetical protein IT385_03875 [Deltaproteobacteria bacterium]|nr:hypothetical protein [Deltaproteobacteria bacterium]
MHEDHGDHRRRLLEDAKRRAEQLDITLSASIEDALRERLTKPQTSRRPKFFRTPTPLERALEHGCEWVTADADFARFAGLRWSHPR